MGQLPARDMRTEEAVSLVYALDRQRRFYNVKFFNLLGCLCLLLAWHCSPPHKNKNPYEKNFDRSVIPNVSLLKGEKYFFEEIKMPGGLLFKQNKLIVSDQSGMDYLTHVVDTDRWEYLYPMGVVGYGPGETAHVWTIESGPDSDSFWIYNLTDKLFSKYPLEETAEKLAISQIKQNEDFFLAMGLTWSSDSTVMTYLANSEDRYVEFKTDGTRLAGYGKWKDLIPGNHSDHIIASVHQGKLTGNLKTDKFLKACILRDRLEIVDKEDGSIISIDGPISHIPKFKVSGSGSSEVEIIQPDQPLAYMDAYLGDRLVFGLYSGKTDQEIMDLGRGETEIFVFDLRGNVLALFNLDTPITAFTIDEAPQRIFGITADEDPGVVVYAFGLGD